MAIICRRLSKVISLYENGISIQMSLKIVPKGPTANIPALVQIMAWRRIDVKPLSEPMVALFTDGYLRHLMSPFIILCRQQNNSEAASIFQYIYWNNQISLSTWFVNVLRHTDINITVAKLLFWNNRSYLKYNVKWSSVFRPLGIALLVHTLHTERCWININVSLQCMWFFHNETAQIIGIFLVRDKNISI